MVPTAGHWKARRLAASLDALGPALLLGFAGAVAALAAAGLVHPGHGPGRLLAAVLPLDPIDPGWLVSALGAITLVALAIGLWRAKRRSWELGLVLFGSAVFAQGLDRHPVGAAVAAACLGALLVQRHRYLVQGARPGRFLVALAGLAVVAAVLDIVVAAVIPGGRLSSSFDVQAGSDALADLVTFGDVGSLAWIAHHGGFLAAITIPVRLAIMLLAVGALRPARMLSPAGEATRTEEILRRDGTGALLPFQLQADKSRILSSSGAVIVYGSYGRMAVALGDAVGPPESVADAWHSFVIDARLRGELPTVYQASSEQRAALIAAGLRPFRVGQEAIVDLANFDLSGSRRANLRHTITRARKGGVTFRFHPAGIPAAELEVLRPGLVAIDREWAASAGPALGFTISQFDATELDRIAISVATDGAGAPVAFTTYRPTGADGGWVLDLMRRSSGGTPGALEGCIAEAASALREAGAPTLSLGLAPLAGLDDTAALPEERGLARAARLVERWYDVRGLAFFKSKFDPRWEPRYAAVESRAELPGFAFALLGLHAGSFRGAAEDVVVDLLRKAFERRPAERPGGPPPGAAALGVIPGGAPDAAATPVPDGSPEAVR